MNTEDSSIHHGSVSCDMILIKNMYREIYIQYSTTSSLELIIVTFWDLKYSAYMLMNTFRK